MHLQMFDGEPLDDVTKELLIASLHKDLQMGLYGIFIFTHFRPNIQNALSEYDKPGTRIPQRPQILPAKSPKSHITFEILKISFDIL